MRGLIFPYGRQETGPPIQLIARNHRPVCIMVVLRCFLWVNLEILFLPRLCASVVKSVCMGLTTKTPRHKRKFLGRTIPTQFSEEPLWFILSPLRIIVVTFFPWWMLVLLLLLAGVVLFLAVDWLMDRR